MMKPRFYYAPKTCALATHIVLEHIGVDYDGIKIDFRENQQRSKEYLAVNPKGRVPALVRRLHFFCIWHKRIPKPTWHPWMIRLPSLRCRLQIVGFVPRCTWSMPMGHADRVGLMMRLPSSR